MKTTRDPGESGLKSSLQSNERRVGMRVWGCTDAQQTYPGLGAEGVNAQ